MEEEDYIIEVLDFLKSKVKNKSCTKEQTDTIYKMISENMDIFATSDELAAHYGKSRDAVHGVIKRRMLEKPRRNVTLYSFKAFRKYVPSSWLKKR